MVVVAVVIAAVVVLVIVVVVAVIVVVVEANLLSSGRIVHVPLSFYMSETPIPDWVVQKRRTPPCHGNHHI